jgi:anthranilate phosphoribosyltransferase
MDELSLCSETKVSEWDSNEFNEFSIRPEDFDLSPCTLDDLKGGDPKENAAIINSILSNEGDGPKRDIVALNAAAGFVVTGIASDIGHGLEIAQRCIKDGTAMGKLDSLRNFKAN